MPINRYHIDEITNHIKKYEIFITCLSYETRCLTIPRNLNHHKLEKIIVIENEGFKKHNSVNREYFDKSFKGKIEFVQTSTETPVHTADNMYAALNELNDSHKNILIDITTFTHESLLIILKLLALNLARESLITFVYCSAATYGGGDLDNMWLSKGVAEVRSVLGYSGDFLPSKKTHLIVLVGFEYERASKLIEVFEPNIISLGCGSSGTETAPKHDVANRHFHELVKKMVSVYSNVNDFEFSCSNPWETKNAILNQVLKYPEYNPIIAPMNTKISTIGCALATKENPSIQLCYAEANLYNIKNYSEPGDTCYLFELPELSQITN